MSDDIETLERLARAAETYAMPPLHLEAYDMGGIALGCHCGGVLAQHSEAGMDDPYFRYLQVSSPAAILALLAQMKTLTALFNAIEAHEQTEKLHSEVREALVECRRMVK